MAETEQKRARSPWDSVFDAPVLRGLDARARREIEDAGALTEYDKDATIYREGEEGASFFVVASGKVGLHALRRGDDERALLRTAERGESFGEEATVEPTRRATAIALERATVATIPVPVFRRAAARSGKAEIAERLERALRRSATRDLLATMAFARDLDPREIDLLLDALQYRHVARGEVIYREGEIANEVFFLADGRVQLQSEEDERLHVRAYLGRGDFFGDVEALSGAPRTMSAVSSGKSSLLALPARLFRELADAHPKLVARLRRVAKDQSEAQRAIVGRAAANATQHAFRDVYRLEIARSLLVIDLDTCARCGHCASSCAEVHGTARLVRRGDKVVARADPGKRGRSDTPQNLLLPSSCQHCENPACMLDCPTGAIGRDPEGEVFIREELCTGCGACARACPWDNIQMADRPKGAKRPEGTAAEHALLAVKCDLCRGYEGPACVQACPTGSIFRINPSEEIADLRELLGRGGRDTPRESARALVPAWTTTLPLGALLAALAIGGVGIVMQGRGLFRPDHGVGLGAGVAAGICMLLLYAYAVPKRMIRLWMRRRAKGRATEEANRIPSRTRPQLSLHLGIGFVTLGLALAHAPLSPSRPRHGAALAIALFLSSAAGAFTALGYRLLPARLARIERNPALPEDFAEARRELFERLYRGVSGKSELVKKIFERILLPYAKHPLGPLLLILSGRSLRAEERTLRERVDRVLQGRGQDRLAGLDELIRVVVELRSLPAQRGLLALLRVGLPLHIVTFGIAGAALLLHVVFAAFRLMR